MKPQVWPKNMHRLLVWLDPLHDHHLPMANSRLLLQNGENSRESLLQENKCSERKARVPKGSLAVYVGPQMRRFVIPASYLSMPDFRMLMERAAEEFGFEQEGGLRIPCEEEHFEEILTRCLADQRTVSKSKSRRKRG